MTRTLNRHEARAILKIKRTGRLKNRGRNKAVQKLLGVDALGALDALRAAPLVEPKRRQAKPWRSSSLKPSHALKAEHAALVRAGKAEPTVTVASADESVRVYL